MYQTLLYGAGLCFSMSDLLGLRTAEPARAGKAPASEASIENHDSRNFTQLDKDLRMKSRLISASWLTILMVPRASPMPVLQPINVMTRIKACSSFCQRKCLEFPGPLTDRPESETANRI